MRKIYVIASVLSFSISAYAQQKVAGKAVVKSHLNLSHHFTSAGTENVNDTLSATLLANCNVGPLLLNSTNGGFVAGTNGYGDLEKAQRIATNTIGKIHSVLVAFGGKTIVGTADEYNTIIYNVNATNGAPSATSIGTSASVSSSNIDTTGQFTKFSFATPVDYSGPFFASVVVGGGTRNDTIGIFHTGGNCGGGSAWEKWDTGQWIALNDPQAWGANVDVVFYIFAEVEKTGNIGLDNEFLLTRNSVKVFPNPANDVITVSYSLSKNTKAQFAIYDLTGRAVLTEELAAPYNGLNAKNIRIGHLPVGVYTYTVRTNTESVSGKLVVRK
ncbi:MAG: T9SS type A sorting domain-containing protein [Thermaurantimonas sp.]